MKSHPMMMGHAKIIKHTFLPTRKDKYPAGIEPKNAPKLIKDPTHDTSSIDRGSRPRSDEPRCNIGVAGADQPPTQPVPKEITDAIM